MSTRDESTWLVKTGPNWDEHLVDFIMFESRVMQNASDTLRPKLSAIRFWHVVFGLDDFAKFGGRYHQALKGMRREHKVNRQIPFTPDVIEWARTHFSQSDLANVPRVELYAATVLGFFFLLRAGNWGTYECQISAYVAATTMTIASP